MTHSLRGGKYREIIMPESVDDAYVVRLDLDLPPSWSDSARSISRTMLCGLFSVASHRKTLAPSVTLLYNGEGTMMQTYDGLQIVPTCCNLLIVGTPNMTSMDTLFRLHNGWADELPFDASISMFEPIAGGFRLGLRHRNLLFSDDMMPCDGRISVKPATADPEGALIGQAGNVHEVKWLLSNYDSVHPIALPARSELQWLLEHHINLLRELEEMVAWTS